MMFWRDEVPLGVQADLDGLFEAALGAAGYLMETDGEFLPLAVVLEVPGGDPDVFGDNSEEESPEALAVLERLYEAARQDRDALVGAAFVADVTLPNGGDGVRVEVEHRDGPALQVVVPYSIRHSKVEFGQPETQAGTANVWDA